MAVVNAPEISAAETLEGIKSKVSFLTDNAPGMLVMYGEDSREITKDPILTIEVKRLAAKIIIDKIANN